MENGDWKSGYGMRFDTPSKYLYSAMWESTFVSVCEALAELWGIVGMPYNFFSIASITSYSLLSFMMTLYMHGSSPLMSLASHSMIRCM